jgi:hypothetical protein
MMTFCEESQLMHSIDYIMTLTTYDDTLLPGEEELESTEVV